MPAAGRCVAARHLRARRPPACGQADECWARLVVIPHLKYVETFI